MLRAITLAQQDVFEFPKYVFFGFILAGTFIEAIGLKPIGVYPGVIRFMKRRAFIHYGAMGSSLFLIGTELFNKNKNSVLPAIMTNEPLYDWIILYWMPYDNDLSSFGIPIMQMLSRGISSSNILVVVESDFSRAKQLSRNVITKGKIATQQLETANSGDENAFAEYLQWAKSNFQAKKWAIAFLGHGGRLDEISPDDNPVPGSNLATQWMNIQKLSDIIAKFHREVGDRVELLFFQNCNKGTLEAHYTVRDTAKYTLSSQLLLGAPNYYYVPLLQFLGNNPEINGGELAAKIIDFESPDMYHSYTVTNNREVQNLPAKLNPLIDSIMSAPGKTLHLRELKPYYYWDEQFVDVGIFFKNLTSQSVASQSKYNEFMSFLKQSMIYQFNQDGALIPRRKKYQDFSGLGIFFPRKREELGKYRYLQCFSDLNLIQLFDRLLFNSKPQISL
ncbi:MAG: hypothetical protein Fur006_08990 [Coleofasciculaceae cyanobacterium]